MQQPSSPPLSTGVEFPLVVAPLGQLVLRRDLHLFRSLPQIHLHVHERQRKSSLHPPRLQQYEQSHFADLVEAVWVLNAQLLASEPHWEAALVCNWGSRLNGI
jgi:hypothetical protein